MTEVQVDQLIGAINNISYSIWWLSLWVALILFFKNTGGSNKSDD